MHDGVQYDPIQGQGHEPLKVGNPFTKAICPDIYNGSWQLTNTRAQYLNWSGRIFYIYPSFRVT